MPYLIIPMALFACILLSAFRFLLRVVFGFQLYKRLLISSCMRSISRIHEYPRKISLLEGGITANLFCPVVEN